MSKWRKLERYFYTAVTFVLATYFAKISLESSNVIFAFLEVTIAVILYMYAVYFTEHTIRKIIELEHYMEE